MRMSFQLVILAPMCCGLILSLVKFYFPLFWGMVMNYNEFESKGNKIETKDKLLLFPGNVA